jgi:hypothetical protein
LHREQQRSDTITTEAIDVLTELDGNENAISTFVNGVDKGKRKAHLLTALTMAAKLWALIEQSRLSRGLFYRHNQHTSALADAPGCYKD